MSTPDSKSVNDIKKDIQNVIGGRMTANEELINKIDTYKVMNQTELKNLSEILSKDLKATLNLS